MKHIAEVLAEASMSGKPSIRFRENTAEAVRDKSLRDAMRNSTDTFTTLRARGSFLSRWSNGVTMPLKFG